MDLNRSGTPLVTHAAGSGYLPNGRLLYKMSFGQSVLDPQTRYAGELIHIRRHGREAQGESLRCDQQIMGADGRTLARHQLTDLSAVTTDGHRNGH